MSDHAGAAKRRRERRLRSWAKHERQTVAMALAEALHHSAPRRPKTARAGVRPGVLEDPGPRRETEHEQHAALRGPKPPSPGVPLLAMPVLAGTAGEAVDRTALSYLLQQSLAATKEEEERKLVELEVKRKEAELQSLTAATREMVQQRAFGSSAWTSTLARKVQLRDELRELRGEKRKKRKKRKKKLPKTSSGYGRPVLRQCGAHSCFSCRDVYPQCVLCRRLSSFYRCCSWTVPPPDIGGVGFGSSPNLDTYHTFYELSLPSERGCPDSAALRAARVFAPLCRVMVAVSLPMVLTILFGTVLCRLLENTSSIFSSTKRSLGCMLADIGSTATTRFALTSTSSRFKLMASVAVRSGSCICTVTRLSRWTVSAWMCCPGVCLASVLHPTRQRITPSMSCACLLSVRWMSLNLADPRSIGKYSGIFVSTAPAVDPEICADNYIYFRFKLQACVAVSIGSCICTAICPSRWTVSAWQRSHHLWVCLPLSVAWE